MKPVVWFRFTFASALLAGCGPGELGQASASSDGSATDSVGTTGPGQTGFIAHYFSPWPQAFMHFDDGSGWTPVPGIAMAPEDGAWRVHRHESGSGSVEFVFNDGGDAWDNNDEMNYATSLREFWVKDGVIHDERPEDGDTDESPFCQSIDCGNGVCNEAEQRCDCDEGYLFDAAELTCIEDLCHGVECGFGELCDPDDGSCLEACVPDRAVGSVWTVCQQTTPSSLAVVARYDGPGQLDLPASVVRLNDEVLDGDRVALDGESRTIAVTAASLEPSKYSVLLRMRTGGGDDLLPLFVPMWIGDGIRYSDFIWNDAILYQILTDRFLDGDPANNIDNSQGTSREVDDPAASGRAATSRGITQKIRDGYFDNMGINTLWISSPLLNSHNSQPAVDLSDTRRFASYHSYHPIVTGYTHLDDFGYDEPDRVRVRHRGGAPRARQRGARAAGSASSRISSPITYSARRRSTSRPPGVVLPYHPCDNNWDEPSHRTAGSPPTCRTSTTAEPRRGHHGRGSRALDDPGVQLRRIPRRRAQAHGRRIRPCAQDGGRRRDRDHGARSLHVALEPTVFYMVGESLGGWARYHVRADMVQGQVDEEYYNKTKAALLTFTQRPRPRRLRDPNDTAYLTSQRDRSADPGGYPGAIMGNFFGNHDQCAR
jgi:hypothetical protein